MFDFDFLYNPPVRIPAYARPLGRLIPDDWDHYQKYPMRLIFPHTVDVVAKTLSLPSWHWSHDQGREGSCVGHAVVMERAITNIHQNRLLSLLYPNRRYNPIHVWNEAKKVDPWPDTNPGDDNGTSVNAGYYIARWQGLRRVSSMKLDDGGVPYPVNQRAVSLEEGVETYRWASTVDEIRTAISHNLPVTIGVNWYSNFDRPISKQIGWRTIKVIGEGNLGSIRGGHALTIYGARDGIEAFKLKNSWGKDYPLVFLPYATMERLLEEDGEAALITDR